MCSFLSKMTIFYQQDTPGHDVPTHPGKSLGFCGRAAAVDHGDLVQIRIAIDPTPARVFHAQTREARTASTAHTMIKSRAKNLGRAALPTCRRPSCVVSDFCIGCLSPDQLSLQSRRRHLTGGLPTVCSGNCFPKGWPSVCF